MEEKKVLDYYAPSRVATNDEHRRRLFEGLTQIIQDARVLNEAVPGEDAYLSELRVDFYERILRYEDPEMRAKLFFMCTTIEEILDPEVNLSVLLTKLARMGDVATDLIASYHAGMRLLDDVNLAIDVLFARRQAELVADTSGLQRQNGGVTNSGVVLSEKNLQASWARLYPDEFMRLFRIKSYVKNAVETIRSLKMLVESANYNHQKVIELSKSF